MVTHTKKEKVVLAYSGGLDTSVILVWLINQGYDVVCFIADVGQEEDFAAAEKKAYALGACKVYVQNLQQAFLEQYIFQALKANALYEGVYLLGTALARPLIASCQVEIARREGTRNLAHGATGKGNDQVRFELAYRSLMPDAHVISPWKEESFLAQFKGRPDLIAYAAHYNIPVTSTAEKPYSLDSNLMHTSYEGGLLEDPLYEPSESMFDKTVSPQKAPDKPVRITLEFKKGLPVCVVNRDDKVTLKKPLEIFKYLNALGGAHGIGRVDIVENRFVGMKSRGVYETPAGTILWKAHRDLESLVLDREVIHYKDMFIPKIAQLIYNGFWFSPEMSFFMAAIDKSQECVEGSVLITLYKGNVIVTGRQSPQSRYKKDVASMDVLGEYNPLDARGFIALQGLRLKNS